MPTALVIQHAAVEGVGRFADWLPAHGLDLEVIHPYAGDSHPVDVVHDALIVMGGPMGAYDDDAAPWLPATKALLEEAVERGVPTLGICLGAQLLAVAAGGTVERGAAGPELGLGEVNLTGNDRVTLGGRMPVVQWHYDTVTELPPNSTLLGSSDRYPVQAFRVGEAAWGLQFHIEASPELVGEWALAEGMDADSLVVPVSRSDAVIALNGQHIARRFAWVVNGLSP